MMTNKIKVQQYGENIEFRAKNCEKFIAILQDELEANNNLLKAEQDFKGSNDPRKIIEISAIKKRIIELEQEISAKKEYVSKLRASQRYDLKEFEKNLAECNSRYKKIIGEADKFVEEDYKLFNGEHPSKKGAMVQFQLNGLLLANEEKDNGTKVFYYNALKKELATANAPGQSV